MPCILQSPNHRWRAHSGNTRMIIEYAVLTPTKEVVGCAAGFRCRCPMRHLQNQRFRRRDRGGETSSRLSKIGRRHCSAMCPVVASNAGTHHGQGPCSVTRDPGAAGAPRVFSLTEMQRFHTKPVTTHILTISRSRGFTQQQQTVVSAAASLTVVLTSLRPEAEECVGARKLFTVAGSGALGKQIEEGAPADVFFSAASEDMDILGAASLLAVGDPDSVPAGRYATQALTSLGPYQGSAPVGIAFLTDALSVRPNIPAVRLYQFPRAPSPLRSSPRWQLLPARCTRTRPRDSYSSSRARRQHRRSRRRASSSDEPTGAGPAFNASGAGRESLHLCAWPRPCAASLSFGKIWP